MRNTKTNTNSMTKKATKMIWAIYAAISCMIMSTVSAYAEVQGPTQNGGGGIDAKAAWNSIFDAIKPFLYGLGGVLVLVGGIGIGLGWKSEDSEGITRGVRTLIAGVAVIAVITVAWAFVHV